MLSRIIFGLLLIGACVDTEPDIETVAAGSGSGSGSACQPRLDLSTYPSTLAADAGSVATFAVNLSSSNYFSGTATLSAVLFDPLGAPLYDWSIALDTTHLTVPYNGTAKTTARVTIPANATRTATARITVSSGAYTGFMVAEATIVPREVITFTIVATDNQCTYPSPGAITYARIGSKLRWLNSPSSTQGIIIHTDGTSNGVAHQMTGYPMAPGAYYEQTLIGFPGSPFRWYCHEPGPFVNNFIQPIN